MPGASYFLLNAIPLSDPDRIQVDAAQIEPDITLFGAEPAHGWCYFYAKAELARQQSDWDRVARLYNQARKEGLGPLVPVENLPFIEAFAMTGDIDMALKLTNLTIEQREDLCPAVNTLWERVDGSASLSGTDLSTVQDQIRMNGCKKP
jgi:hypothetical protein